MRPPPRSLLHRPAWLRRSRAPHGKSLPGPKPLLSTLNDVRETGLEHHLHRETGLKLFPDTPTDRLERALALRVTKVLDEHKENLHIQCKCPSGERQYLDKFNLYLWNASLEPKDPFVAKELWRWYVKATVTLPAFLPALSPKAWDTVFLSQSLRALREPKAVAHLNKLVEDMRNVGYSPSYDQRLVNIESLFGRGFQKEALAEWQKGYKTDGGRTEGSYRSDFLELGIRMYSAAGEASEALRHLVDLFALYPESKPRLVLPVFHVHVQSGHVQHAWALYLYLKDKLGDDMSFDDYERCYLAFLQSGHGDRALAVFRDMMLHSDAYTSNERILKGFNDLDRVMKSVEQLNDVFLSGISIMPRKLQNHFFYSKWVKQLVERKHLDAAAQVFELMFERGIQPRARDINRLMGAWVQTGNAANIQRAETLGLQMVVERIALVQRRSRIEKPPRPKLDKLLHTRQKLFLRRTLPPATSQTFDVLMQIYLNAGDEEKMQDLQDWQIRQAELPITTFAMNSQMASHLQHGHLDSIWRIYKRAVLRRPSDRLASTLPNTATFTYLWEAARAKVRTRGRTVPQRTGTQHFPPPAIVLRELLRWLAPPSPSGPAALPPLADTRIPLLILSTFTATNDLPGALVAASALHHRLSLPPTPQTANLLARAISILNFPAPANTPPQRRRIAASALLERNLASVLGLLRSLLERRLQPYQEAAAAAAAAAGGVPSAELELDDHQRAGLLLDALSELVRAALVRSGWAPERVEAAIRGVKNAIRVPADMPTGDRTAWDVV